MIRHQGVLFPCWLSLLEPGKQTGILAHKHRRWKRFSFYVKRHTYFVKQSIIKPFDQVSVFHVTTEIFRLLNDLLTPFSLCFATTMIEHHCRRCKRTRDQLYESQKSERQQNWASSNDRTLWILTIWHQAQQLCSRLLCLSFPFVRNPYFDHHAAL